MSVGPTDPAHELDTAWIIAFWLAVHGGDPSPEIVAARAVSALTQYVNGTVHHALIFESLKAQFGRLGVTVTERTKQEVQSTALQPQSIDDGEAREFRIHQYCFKFEGSMTRTELPVLTHLRTAA